MLAIGRDLCIKRHKWNFIFDGAFRAQINLATLFLGTCEEMRDEYAKAILNFLLLFADQQVEFGNV